MICYQFLHIFFSVFKYQIRAVQEATADIVSSQKAKEDDDDEQQSPQNWKIKMLYDGDCPLCMREVFSEMITVGI